MSFISMDLTALRLAVNSPENLKRDIGDLQSQGRVISKIVTDRAQMLHLGAHISLFSTILLGTFSVLSLFSSEAVSILLSVITSVSSTMMDKDQLLDPLVDKITRLLSRNELEEIDTIKDLINTKADMLMKSVE